MRWQLHFEEALVPSLLALLLAWLALPALLLALWSMLALWGLLTGTLWDPLAFVGRAMLAWTDGLLMIGGALALLAWAPLPLLAWAGVGLLVGGAWETCRAAGWAVAWPGGAVRGGRAWVRLVIEGWVLGWVLQKGGPRAGGAWRQWRAKMRLEAAR